MYHYPAAQHHMDSVRFSGNPSLLPWGETQSNVSNKHHILLTEGIGVFLHKMDTNRCP